MRRFAFDAPEPPDPDEWPDAVLVTTRELVAAAATLGLDPMRYAEALRAFRRAVRGRYDAEVARGLPADVVRHVMGCAIRMAVEGAPALTGSHLIVEIGALTLTQAQRGGRGDGIP